MDVKVEKSEEFAVRIVECYNFLCKQKSEFVMSKQLLRAGTSIGANIAESIYAESSDDFVHKLSISQKEASETRYWLKLLFKTQYLPEDMYLSLNSDCCVILNIVTSIISSIKSKSK